MNSDAAPRFLTKEEIEAGLAAALVSPRDDGTVEMIVSRPAAGERTTPERAHLSRAGGVEGDHWAKGCWRTLPNGGPHPDVQVAISNARALDLFAGGDRSRWALSGDNLIVDLDISEAALSPGARLRIGEAVLEITEEPFAGCKKYVARYGLAATQYANTVGRPLRLRGVYARVVEDGHVAVGDRIRRAR